MRIVLDLQACQASSMHRGIGRYSLALAQAMVRQGAGHDIRIVLNSGFPDSAAALRMAFSSLLPAAAIHSFATPLPVAEGNPDNRWRLLAAERIREHYLASLRPDAVHVSSLFEGFGDNSVNSVLHGAGAFDTAVTLYDLIPLLRKERYLDDPNIAVWYYRKLDSLKKAELLLAISGSARTEAIDALRLAPDRVINISSAADAMFAPRMLAPDERAGLLARLGLRRPFIMYTGGIDYRKNIEGLIEAYAALPGALRAHYQLAVVCSIRDPDRVRLQRLAARLRLADDDLVLTGYVADDDLVALYNCTALFVFPSLHEGFGLPVLEAMACGAPVIGANTSSIPEVIGRQDAMFDPTSVPAITAALARVLGDPDFAAALRAHGLVQAKQFSWDASATRAIAALEESHQRRTATRTVTVDALPRPRLLLVAPPGLATTAALAAAMAPFYDVVQAPAVPAEAPHRIVYQIANVPASAPVLAALADDPGVVILDEFALDAALPAPDRARALYLSHGYQALLGDGQAYPGNRAVLDRALGVIVPASAMLDEAQAWYGPQATDGWHVAAPGDNMGAQLRDAIEAVLRDGQPAAEQRLVRTLGAGAVAASDLVQTAAALAANRPAGSVRQLLLDVTQLTAVPGWQELVLALIAATPAPWRVEPVQHDGQRYRYARERTLALLGRAEVALADAVAEAHAGDVLAGIDPDAPPLFPAAWQARGILLHRYAPTGVAAHDCASLLAAILQPAAPIMAPSRF